MSSRPQGSTPPRRTRPASPAGPRSRSCCAPSPRITDRTASRGAPGGEGLEHPTTRSTPYSHIYAHPRPPPLLPLFGRSRALSDAPRLIDQRHRRRHRPDIHHHHRPPPARPRAWRDLPLTLVQSSAEGPATSRGPPRGGPRSRGGGGGGRGGGRPGGGDRPPRPSAGGMVLENPMIIVRVQQQRERSSGGGRGGRGGGRGGGRSGGPGGFTPGESGLGAARPSPEDLPTQRRGPSRKTGGPGLYDKKKEPGAQKKGVGKERGGAR